MIRIVINLDNDTQILKDRAKTWSLAPYEPYPGQTFVGVGHTCFGALFTLF